MKHGRQPHGSQEQVPPDIRGIVSSGIKSAPEVEPSPLPQGSTLEQMITCGLFSRGGYGQVGRPIFEFLSRCHNPTGWTQSEIVYAVGLPQSTTCKILQKMVRDGLVLKDRKHYIANPNPNFMAIGEQHGTKDIIADRHARHEAQRAEFEPHE